MKWITLPLSSLEFSEVHRVQVISRSSTFALDSTFPLDSTGPLDSIGAIRVRLVPLVRQTDGLHLAPFRLTRILD